MTSDITEAVTALEVALDCYALAPPMSRLSRAHLEAALAATGALQRALIEARLEYRDGWGNEPRKSIYSTTNT